MRSADIIYGSVGTEGRSIMAVIAAILPSDALRSFPPAVADYVTLQRSGDAYLDIRFDWLFSIYLVFAVASIARYLWLGWCALRGDAPEAPDPTKASSGI
jgi:hypothetical protein